MKRIILFDGKVTLADKLVDFRIYKNEEEDMQPYYSFEVNPEVRDVNQEGFHRGETQRADDLDTLLFRFRQFQREFMEIDESRTNRDF